MIELLILSGKHQGKKLSLPETEVVVGRDETCHLRLASEDVSRRHCALRATADGVVVRDLNSRNGTFVNDAPIEGERLLLPGDELRIGMLLLRAPGARPAAKGDHEKPVLQVPEKKPAAEGLSDDEIAAWLSDVPPGDAAAGPGDTTIIPAQPTPAAEPPAAAPERKKSVSVAEEAAEIIRRHHERQRKQRG